MSKKPDIQFGVQFAVDKQLIEQSNGDVVKYQKDKWARDLGMMIADKKDCWEEISMPFSENNETYRMKVYVFTAQELKDYAEAIVLKKVKL